MENDVDPGFQLLPWRIKTFFSFRKAVKISNSDFRAAQKNPQIQRFVADALAQERRLENDGLIRRPGA